MYEELNKKLAEWRFPNAKEITLDDEHILVVFEHGNKVMRLFTQSLDACFKWLVPKVHHGLGVTVVIYSGGGDTVGYPVVELRKGDKRVVPLEMDSEYPALSLCLAIEKLIEAKG